MVQQFKFFLIADCKTKQSGPNVSRHSPNLICSLFLLLKKNFQFIMFTQAIKLIDEVLASCSNWTLYAACVGLYTPSLKSIVTQPWNLLPFTETEGLLWCSRQPAIGLHPGQNKIKSVPFHLMNVNFKMLSHLRMSSRWPHSLRFPDPNSPRFCVSIVCYKPCKSQRFWFI